MKRLMITVDVEAQPARAECDHVDRLIWGKYPEGRAGIGEMMDIADKYGVKLTTFLDYCERALYGEAILDVGREIHRRGHDLQLHAHPEFFAETFWSSKGLSRPTVMNDATDAQANALFEYLCESQMEAGGDAPLGYRGGGYRYGPAMLRAMAHYGLKLNSSYIAARDNQPLKLGRIRQFYWDNGCLEIPVSCVNPFLNLTRDFDINFNASAFSSAGRMMLCLDAFYRQQGEDAIAVMVLHSWSFSKRQDNGLFSPPLPESVARFDDFLSSLKAAGIKVITTAQAIDIVASDECAAGPTVSVEKFEVIEHKDTVKSGAIATSHVSVSYPSAPVDAPSPTEITCNVCGTPVSSFEDYNGRTKARCLKCGSVERQRIFVDIYDTFLKDEYDLRDKRVLALSPSHSEKLIYAERGITNLISCDVQPNLKTDIVADITNMPQVQSASFDAVIASYVMTCVHDLNAALGEIHRVLKPDGRFLFCDPLAFNAVTVENTDNATITSWYGQQAYDKYRIGSFRRLGDIGVLGELARCGFLTKTFYGRDRITGTKWVWHSAMKSVLSYTTPTESKRNGEKMAALAELHWSAGNYVQAIGLHERAHEISGVSISGYRLGTAYLLGKGQDKDIERAWQYLSDAAQKNVRYACHYRGVILSDPAFSGFDLRNARAEFEKAAELGVAEAELALRDIKLEPTE